MINFILLKPLRIMNKYSYYLHCPLIDPLLLGILNNSKYNKVKYFLCHNASIKRTKLTDTSSSGIIS